jgi:hypothetical protein
MRQRSNGLIHPQIFRVDRTAVNGILPAGVFPARFVSPPARYDFSKEVAALQNHEAVEALVEQDLHERIEWNADHSGVPILHFEDVGPARSGFYAVAEKIERMPRVPGRPFPRISAVNLAIG